MEESERKEEKSEWRRGEDLFLFARLEAGGAAGGAQGGGGKLDDGMGGQYV